MACETRREGDEYVCRCGRRWDVTDPDPPVCQKTAEPFVVPDTPVKIFRSITLSVPEGLPAHLADLMALAYTLAISRRESPREAMQAAWRRFLDET